MPEDNWHTKDFWRNKYWLKKKKRKKIKTVNGYT